MAAKNDITGDAIKTKANSAAYAENIELIFGKKEKKDDSEYWAKLDAETKEKMDKDNE